MNSKFGFWLRWTATEFESASIAQLIQVEVLAAPAAPDSNSGRLLAKFPNFESISV